jgi:3-oxoacyl-[acyl-carrier protein] reductase
MDLDLKAKTALVTGAHRGTGGAIAAALAREGARVLVHGLKEGSADPNVAAIVAAGGDAVAIHGDIATDGGTAAALRQAAAHGPVDILVNNYGAAERGTWTGSDDADWRRMYEVNVLSGVRLARALMGPMAARRFGRILFLGTVGGLRPNARMPHYYTAKTALRGLIVSLAKELGGTGVTVNMVSPGLIGTKEVLETMSKRAAREGWTETGDALDRRYVAAEMPNPVGRLARPEEVADFVAFLASPRAGYLTGQDIRFDGGAAGVAT